MTTKIKYAEHVDPVKPKTKEMELLLQVGYQMTIDEAKELVASRVKDAATVPWEVYKAAQAMIAAYQTPAKVVSTRPGWKRHPSREEVLSRARGG